MESFTLREKYYPLIRKCCSLGLLVASLFVTSLLQAQAVVDIFNLPEPERCTSNDLRVVEASLEFDLCGPSCEEGEVIEYPLTLAIFNNTGSLRTSFAFYSRLEQYDADGNLENTYFITGCKGPVPPNTTTEITFEDSLEILDENGQATSFEGIPYLCGGSLKLVNLYQAWTDASGNDNRQCPLEASKINPKCDVLKSIEIQTPLSAFVDATSDVTCYDGADGTIDITVNGGEEPYSFSWTRVGNGFSAGTEDLLNIPAGTYNVTVTDAQGCTESLEGIVVGSPDILDADVASQDVTCFDGNDGSITITNPSGGHANYEYSIDGGTTWQAGGTFTGLSADTYSVFIRDADYTDCFIDLGDQVVDEPEVLAAHVDSTNVSCFGEDDGTITIFNASGGSGNYQYSINGGSSWQDSGAYTGLAAGDYDVFIRDADATACYIDLADVSISQPDELVVSKISITDATCSGFQNGAIEINVIGGTPPYDFLWSNAATTQNLSEVGAGVYSVTVTDANGCEDTLANLEVKDPSGLEAEVTSVTEVSCNGFEDGAINITVSGGTTPYSFEWSNADTSEDISGLAAGSYDVTITDANGCEFTINDILVGEPEVLDVQVAVEDVSCPGFTDGKITLTASGGTSPYTSDYGDFDDAGILVIDNLSAGEYGVVVSDASGCSLAIDGILVSEPEETVIPDIETQLADCRGGNGSFIFVGDPQNLYISFNDGGTFDLYDGPISLAVGIYDFVVKYGEDGCVSDPGQVQISTPQQVEFILNAEITQPDCETGLGNILIRVGDNATVDTGFFTYTISSGGTVYYNEKQTSAGFDLLPGTYLVQGISDNGCASGITEVTLDVPICDDFEGCTLGYWKNHTNRWCYAYSTCDRYGDIFTSAPNKIANYSLLEALNLGGGGIYNLARQSVAALLNTCSADVNFEYTSIQGLIADVNAAFVNGTAGSFGSHLDGLNQAGCPLGGTSATTAASNSCAVGAAISTGSVSAGFKVTPVPFKQSVSIKYDFDYTSDVRIEFFDLNSRLLRTYNDKKVSKGSETQINIDFALKANQVYILRVVTNRESFSKNIISGK